MAGREAPADATPTDRGTAVRSNAEAEYRDQRQGPPPARPLASSRHDFGRPQVLLTQDPLHELAGFNSSTKSIPRGALYQAIRSRT